jgi:hypothetical protein
MLITSKALEIASLYGIDTQYSMIYEVRLILISFLYNFF